VIRNLCSEFFPDCEVIIHPTVREHDGLAMSSRNNKLSTEERKRAPLMHQCLSSMACHLYDQLVDEKKNIPIKLVKEIGLSFAAEHDVELEYISFHNAQNGSKLDGDLDALSFVRTEQMVISIAGSVGTSTRLIDNILIGGKDNNTHLWEGASRSHSQLLAT